ncbi:nucleoside triphosphate pyrophosphohydrolase [Calycomorphotria hydatis]|nr:nucleoside triphosphate pyrophosphohydrolase [Calycomorphotria hydatis]
MNSKSTAPAPTAPGTAPDPDRCNAVFEELCAVIAKLRSPEGCPWDREQTLESIKPYTLEETYELLEAIDSGDDGQIIEELGDVLLQVMLDSQIAADEARFNLIDVIEHLKDKLIRRHPHVFGEETAEHAADVSPLWEKAKAAEKSHRESIFDGIPKDLPQLARAQQVTKKAAKVGYDFPHRAMLFDKLNEELAELAAELFEDGNIPHIPAEVDAEVVPDEHLGDAELRDKVEDELGDVLFVIANIARRWGINPEEALRKSNRKFVKRVQFIERELKADGSDIKSATLIEMEKIYQRGKQLERESNGSVPS